MKLIHFFIIFVILISASLGITIVATKDEPTALLYVAEGLCIATLLFLFYFYNKVMRPIKSISSGMELLMEQDLTTRLTTVGQKETDKIVRVFNRLLDKLKDEHLRLREQNNFLDLLIDASPMGVIMLDLNGNISSVNNAALNFLDIKSIGTIKNKKMEELDSLLAKEIGKMDSETTKTFRLGGSAIYRCSHLFFLDRGFHHPFILIESLTQEVLEAEKKAYGKVIRMMAHEVNNNVAGITSILESIDGLPEDLAQDPEVMKLLIRSTELSPEACQQILQECPRELAREKRKQERQELLFQLLECKDPMQQMEILNALKNLRD